MKIMIFAGKQTEMISKLLGDKSTFEISGSDNISTGLKELTYLTDIEKILLVDSGFFIDGRQIEIGDIVEALKTVTTVERELIVMTKDEKLKTAFEAIFFEYTNVRIYLVSKVTTGTFVDCILNRYKETPKVETQHVVQPIVQETLQAEEVRQEVLYVEEPEPKPDQQKPRQNQPVKKDIPEKKVEPEKPAPTQRKRPIFSRRSSLEDILVNRKIVIITGNPNSGVTSTAVGLATILCKSNIETTILDLDIYTKGINLYFDNLDSSVSTELEKAGLTGLLNDFTNIEDCKHLINENLGIVGLNTDYPVPNAKESMKDSVSVAELAELLINFSHIVLIHVPMDILVNQVDLIKTAEKIVYVTKDNINGVYTTCRNLCRGMSNFSDNVLEILKRKTNFVIADSLNNKDFKVELFEASEKTLNQNVIGIFPHINDFDKFKETKTNPLEFKGFKDIYYEIAKELR